MRILLTLAWVILAGCHFQKPAAKPPPPPSVSVSRPVSRQVTDWDEYAGHLQAPKVANITARISGFVEKVPFKEGALVHEGEVLFLIDDRLFKADLENKRAMVEKDEAQLALARAQLNRSSDLLKKRAIAQQDFDIASAQAAQAGAQLAADKAAEQTAQLNLEWTRVLAPISGRIGRILVTEGNQVSGGAGQATVLTTIVSVDPIYCYVSIPGRAFLQYQQLAERQSGEKFRRQTVRCYIGLETEAGFPHPGVINFVDNTVDPNTGTIVMRGVIPNPGGALTPGIFARMRIPRGEPYTALLVPDRAVGTEQSERFVRVVGRDDIVASRPVKTGGLFGDLRSVLSGLTADDRVVVNGIQKAEPGSKVLAQEVPAEGPGSANSSAHTAGIEPP